MSAGTFSPNNEGVVASAQAKQHQTERANATAIRCHALNAVVDRAVSDLRLPVREKRAAFDTLRFSEADFHNLTGLEARSRTGSTIALAAWESLVATSDLGDPRILMLRSVCVDPDWQGCGIGNSLVESVVRAADERGTGLIVTYAWPSAGAFFERRGFRHIPSDFNLNGYLRPLALRLANGSA